METTERLKPLSLFLKDGKLFGSVMPEKPQSNGALLDRIFQYDLAEENEEYERAKSEALRQAMEVVDDYVFGVWQNGKFFIWSDSQSGAYRTLKEGEFYTWEHSYAAFEACEDESCPFDEGCEHCRSPKKLIKLLPMSNVKEEPFTVSSEAMITHVLSPSVETETQEQFAIRFAEWVVDNHWTKFGKGNWYIQNYIGQTFYKTTSELMEIFKQQPK